LARRSSHPVISGSTGPIFTKFSPCGRYFIVNYWSDLFLIVHGMLLWQPILKSAKSVYSSLFIALVFRNGLEYCNSDFKGFNRHSNRRSPLVDQQFGYVRLATPLLDPAEISTKFCAAISTQVLFHLFAKKRHCCAARATR